MQHWTITREADGLATLTFDKANASTNTLSAAVLAELNEALDVLDREPPKGLIVRSGKANGFIAGADVDEFGEIATEAGAIALVKRGWDTSSASPASRYPTLALIRGFCLGGGLELALACRYRVAVDEPGTRLGLPEVMLGIVPGLGRASSACRGSSAAPAALDMLLTGKTVDAQAREAHGPRRRGGAGAHHGELAARGVLRALPAPRTLPLRRRRSRSTRSRAASSPRRPRSRCASARGASTTPRRTRSSSCS